MGEVMKVKLSESQPVPKYQTKGSAGLDLCATHEIAIGKGDYFVMDLGIACDIPDGYYGKLVVRSSMVKRGVVLANALGVIDSDYTGNIHAPLFCYVTGGVHIKKGERIVQLLICPVEQVDIQVVDSLDETERGPGGFGSTGE